MHAKSAKFAFSMLLSLSSIPLSVSAANKAPIASNKLQDLAESKEEAFLIRRIAEFWKDEDYKLVQKQILSFLIEYPNSKIGDHLRAILADLYLQENLYSEALKTYQTIKDPSTSEKVLINKLQCYYELSLFTDMIKEGSPYLKKSSSDIDLRKDEFTFLMAEAYFRSFVTCEDKKKKLELIEQAKPLYESIIHTSFNDPTMFALAEIYRTFGDYKKSASYFSQLAERHSERKEELMFHTALCQAEYDRSLAIQTFSSIIEKDGAKANDAKLNRLILFFQEDRFQDVLSHYPDVASSLEQEKELSLDYIVGRSHFAEKNYEQAIAFLTRYTSFEESLSPQYRNSLLMLMNCAQKLDNEESFDMALTRFENLFPLDDELPQAIFIHAMMLKEAGNFLEAEQKLEQIITNYPNFEDTETLFLEYSLVTYNNQRFEKSHSTLNSFVHHYPKSHHSKIAWKYLLSCSLNLAKQVEGNGNTYYTKNNFLQDLTNVIKEEGVLSQEELKECLFLQAKVMYELGLYDVALNKLNEYLIEYKDDPSIPETHLLIALSHHKVGKNPELFCKHAENALKIDPDLKNKSSIHLELYNVYLSMIEKASIHSNRMQADQVELNSLYQLAAEHLYQAMSLKDLPVKLENKLWLANYYYDKLMKPTYLFEADPSTDSLENNELYQRSYNLFETILISSSEKLINLTNDQTHLEWEVLKFANLLGKEKKLKQKMLVLKDLAEQQQLNRSWDWKLQKETLLELAKTYEYLEDQENAYETYNFISTNYRSKPTFVSEFATLHANRLQFHLLSTNQKIEDNPQVVQILNNLKELQIRKHAQSEPIHLEASIEYSWIRANMISKDECEERYVFFLNRIQEDYSNQEDPIVVRYGDMLKKQNDKQELFDLYMRFVKAEILRTESLIEEKNGNRVSALSKQEEAEKLLNGCLASNYLTHYLYNRIQNSQKAIQAGKLY